MHTDPIPMMVFQCLSCNNILGDSQEFVCSVEDLQLITLKGAALALSLTLCHLFQQLFQARLNLPGEALVLVHSHLCMKAFRSCRL